MLRITSLPLVEDSDNFGITLKSIGWGMAGAHYFHVSVLFAVSYLLYLIATLHFLGPCLLHSRLPFGGVPELHQDDWGFDDSFQVKLLYWINFFFCITHPNILESPQKAQKTFFKATYNCKQLAVQASSWN